MKTRLFITLLALAFAPPAAAQTAQDAWDYLQSQCGDHQIDIGKDGMAAFIDNDDDPMTVNLKEIAVVERDSDGDTVLRCRKLKNPFATSGERHACIQTEDYGRWTQWFLDGCQQREGVTKALHFLIKQHNPEVELNLDH